MDEQLDTAVLLARFKLLLRRQLAEAIDLDKLTRDPDYARTRLAQIEDMAENEDLLVMLLKVRERILPPASAPITPEPSLPAPAAAARDYKFGARSW